MDSYGRIGLNDYTTYHKHGYFIGTIRFLTNGTLPTLRRYLSDTKEAVLQIYAADAYGWRGIFCRAHLDCYKAR
jgi:hypothetical protein